MKLIKKKKKKLNIGRFDFIVYIDYYILLNYVARELPKSFQELSLYHNHFASSIMTSPIDRLPYTREILLS